MKIENSESEKQKKPSRRDILRWGLLGAGALLGTAAIYSTIDQLQAPEYSSQRSNEFSSAADWKQDFANSQSATLDTDVWRYDNSPDVPGYNNELQGYSNRLENVRLEAGVGLVIEAHKRDYQYPNDTKKRQFAYTSGRIDTLNSFSFEYGKIEATMKLPQGSGVWPAFWLLSGNEIHTVDKDFSQKQIDDKKFYLRNGEIDIMEYYGNNPNTVEATVLTFNGTKSNTLAIKNAASTFHKYGVEITPNNIIWTLDDVPYYTFVKKSNNPKDWPFGNNNQLYVILNLAMGGPAGKVDTSLQPWRMEVADVAFYDFTGERP